MSHYPNRLPLDLDDVRRGHIVGKVTDLNQHNQNWLRHALDIAMRDIHVLEAELRDTQNELIEERE